MDSLSDRELEQLFPKLKASGYKVTSPDSHLYNCIAWAFGDSSNWWEPTPFADYYWPDDLSRENTINTFTKLCNKFGYVKCEEGNLEVGYEKIAMYISKLGELKHVARQLDNGNWTSKIGNMKDIEHDSLDGLEGNEYGIVGAYFKKKQ